jgi:predicted outer membrane repeat protein
VITGNRTTSSGGGIYSSNAVTLNQSTVSGNNAGNNGGGIYSYSPVILNQSTVSGNSAGSSGGGIYGYNAVTLNQSTVSGNSTTSRGGGIYSYYGTVSINQSTITANSANGNAGGIYVNDPTTVTLSNSILSGNSGGNGNIDFGTTLNLNAANSLFGDPAAEIGGTNTANVFTDAPNLGSLRDNGGATLTHLPLAGSPALDSGSNPAAPFDQRGTGFPRIFNGTVDIGAVEKQTNQQSVAIPIFSLSGLLTMIAGLLAISWRRLLTLRSS